VVKRWVQGTEGRTCGHSWYGGAARGAPFRSYQWTFFRGGDGGNFRGGRSMPPKPSAREGENPSCPFARKKTLSSTETWGTQEVKGSWGQSSVWPKCLLGRAGITISEGETRNCQCPKGKRCERGKKDASLKPGARRGTPEYIRKKGRKSHQGELPFAARWWDHNGLGDAGQNS